VYLKAHNGNYVDVGVQNSGVYARWNAQGTWQGFIIEKPNGNGSVLLGDTIVLRAHTGKMIDVVGSSVQARWFDYGAWQSLSIEKATARRLLEDPANTASVGVVFGALAGISSMVVLASFLCAGYFSLHPTVPKVPQLDGHKIHPSCAE
jgi:hypothetical protein